MSKLLPNILIAVLLSSVSTAAFAAPVVKATAAVAPARAPATVARAKAYAKKHKLPTREVSVIAKNGQKLTRLFVPVMKHTEPEFFTKFSTKFNTVIWRDNGRDAVHAHIMLAPKNHVHTSSKPGSDHTWQTGSQFPGRYVAMELSQKEIKHMVGRFKKVGESSLLHTPLAKQQEIVGKDLITSSGCMWWLVHAETAPNVGLATALGTSRSAAPENMIRKIIHQAGTKVSVIGVAVKNVEEFKAMSKESLLGPAPKTKHGDP